MDSYMEIYFERVFSNKDRHFLNERYKRNQLVEYFSTVIVGCAKGQHISEDAVCKKFILCALKYHNACKSKNGDVCLMGKYHHVLYVAIKIAFDWRLQDNGVVAALLDEIYACEGTFERILLGAIFGTTATYFLAGWKSDFHDKLENKDALIYFLDHAANANLEYNDSGKILRFVDVPFECCGKSSPVRVVIQMGFAEELMILLRFGAKISTDNDPTNAVESILDRLLEFKRKYRYDFVMCLKFLLRAMPKVNFTVNKKNTQDLELPSDYNYQRKIALEKYGELLKDHLIPSTRCGLKPVELKHMCRCIIREALWKKSELPFGIQKLALPKQLKKYLDLFYD